MYIIGSQVSDDQIPQVAEEIRGYIENAAGLIEKHEELGKKKLAYPVKKTRVGYYVVDNFSAPSDKLSELEHKLRTSQSIIRHLVVNMDEAMVRMEKDRTIQAKLKLQKPALDVRPEAVRKAPAKPQRKIEIDLDAEIEKALESEDLK